MTTEEYPNCVFCNGSDFGVMFPKGNISQIICCTCGAVGPIAKSDTEDIEDLAWKLWRSRPIEEQLRASILHLKTAIGKLKFHLSDGEYSVCKKDKKPINLADAIAIGSVFEELEKLL